MPYTKYLVRGGKPVFSKTLDEYDLMVGRTCMSCTVHALKRPRVEVELSTLQSAAASMKINLKAAADVGGRWCVRGLFVGNPAHNL